MEQIQGYRFAIDLNDNGMTRSLRALRDEAKLLRSSMQANFAEIRSGEGIMAAYANKIEDAKRAVEGQRVYIERLKKEQDGLDLSTDKGRQAYIKYENQINSAKRTIASLEAQGQRAKKVLEDNSSAVLKQKEKLETHRLSVLKLKDALETTEKINKNYVAQLEAEGKKYSAQKAKVKGLIDTQKGLETQLKAEKSLLVQIEQTSGKTSKAYQDQAVRVSDLTTKYVQSKHALKESNTSVLGMSDSMVKFKDHVSIAGDVAKSSFNKIKEHAVMVAGAVGALGKLSIDGAKKASEVSSQYQVIYNNLVTGGESAAEATKKVKQMQEDGAKYSVKYGISQKEIADGYLELIKRGYNSSQALGAMNSELQGSIASGDDFKDVLSVSSQVLESFRMNVDKNGDSLKSTAEMTKRTNEVVNVLTYTSDMSSASVHSLGKGMEYVSSTAEQAHFSLSETSAAMGVLSDNGLEADKALVKLAA